MMTPSSCFAFLKIVHCVQALDPSVELLLPLERMAKGDIIRMAHRQHMDLSATYSCMVGRELHCGR